MITKLGSDYKITEKGTNGHTLSIKAYISEEGITLFNNNEQLDFTFWDSKPEMLIGIGKLLIESAKLYKKEYEN